MTFSAHPLLVVYSIFQRVFFSPSVDSDCEEQANMLIAIILSPLQPSRLESLKTSTHLQELDLTLALHWTRICLRHWNRLTEALCPHMHTSSLACFPPSATWTYSTLFGVALCSQVALIRPLSREINSFELVAWDTMIWNEAPNSLKMMRI